jgi:hypothetical protein
MPALSSDLYIRCRTSLLKCREFGSYKALRAVFVTDELVPFRMGLPSADRPISRFGEIHSQGRSMREH